MAKKEHILIFEPLSNGHRMEFLSHLLCYLKDGGNPECQYTFVVDAIPPAFADGTSVSNVVFDVLSDHDRDLLAKAQRSLRGTFAFWRVLQKKIGSLNPDRLIIMDLTYLELALCFNRLVCRTSAILFVQYPELRAVIAPAFKSKFKFALKELKTRVLLRNRNLDRILLLNGNHASSYLNRRFETSRFIPIPDPVPLVVPEVGFDLRKEYGIEDHRCIFLLFGSMSPRKGVGSLVAALELLPVETACESAFVFCGKPEPNYEVRYQKMVKQLQEKRPDICLCLEKQFVSNHRMRAMFEQSDWILMPYTRPEYSSGILAHAAAARTPVIGSCDGLLGRQIREHGLGRDTEIEPESLSNAVQNATASSFGFDEEKRLSFVNMSSPEQFSSMVLEG
jgi:glycosyltransferase involved in cell wall biosynthesis